VLKRVLVSAALAGGLLVAPVAASAPAFAAVQTHAAESSSACTYRRDGNVWRCITPGAFCPKAAHGKIGYAKATNKRYRCTYKNSDPYWRWRRA
jgi:hypothetical protein